MPFPSLELGASVARPQATPTPAISAGSTRSVPKSELQTVRHAQVIAATDP